MNSFNHPEAQALWQMILANPDDDAPRLILADWLDEHGDPDRAEFIRLECAVAREPFADETIARRARRNILWEKLRTHLLPAMPQRKGIDWGFWRRGFCAQASWASVQSLVRTWNGVRKLLPITDIVLRNNQPLTGLPDWPQLKHVRGLYFRDNYRYLTNVWLTELLRSPHWTTLRELGIGTTPSTSYIAVLLAETPACAQLERLTLSYEYSHHEDYLPHLAALQQLKVLRLAPSSVSLGAWTQYIHAPNRQLESLELGHPFDADCIDVLLNSPSAAKLKQLTCRVTQWQTLASLLQTTQLPNLRELALDVHCHISVDHLQTINAYRGLASLQSLRITNLPGPSDLITRIIQSPFAVNLRYLSLHYLQPSASQVAELLQPDVLPNIEQLALSIHHLPTTTQKQLQLRYPASNWYDCPSLYG